MKGSTAALLASLKKDVQEDIQFVKRLNSHSQDQLNFKENPETWSILENLEHLNLYGDFYLPEIKEGISKAKDSEPTKEFKSSWLGEYFANAMLPKSNGEIQKMKTFKNKDPKNSNLPKDKLDRFLKQQNELLLIIDQARKVNIKKAKSGTTIAKWVKVNVGDILRVVVYHNRRHMNQIQRIPIT